MRTATERLVIGVLSGGDTAEREISLHSGAHVREALETLGHSVVPIDPAVVDVSLYDWTGIDAAFNSLHGPFGEDGRVQAILEARGVPYTGSGVEASRLAMSKSAAKERFLQAGVPTPEYVLIHESDTASTIRDHAKRIGYPLVVKPNSQGSSFGVTIVANPDELPAALSRCFQYDTFGLIERAIAGQEWTVGLIDDELLPLIHIETDREFFDFQAKYEDDDTRYLFESGAAPEVERRIAEAGRNACRALGTRGMARVDVRLDRFSEPWVLEVNTVPGFTDHSLVPKMIARTGRSFGEACEQAVRSALWQRGHLRRVNRVA